MTQTPSRETVVTQVGDYKIKHYAWINGREHLAIQSVYLKSAQLSIGADGKTPKIEKIDPEVEQQATKKMLELLVISVNDSTENPVDVIYDLPLSLFNQVLAVIDEIGKKK